MDSRQVPDLSRKSRKHGKGDSGKDFHGLLARLAVLFRENTGAKRLQTDSTRIAINREPEMTRPGILPVVMCNCTFQP